MYCKHCGKYLEEGTRFCDRCGQSVRRNANSEQAVRHQNIEELKEERLNRRKRLAEVEAREEMRNRRRQTRHRQNLRLAAFMAVVLILAIVCVVAGYRMMSSSTSRQNDASATQTPQTTQASGVGIANNGNGQNSQNGEEVPSDSGEYRVYEVNNVACPYPSDFGKKAVTGNEKLSLVDSVGGGVMSISQELGVSGTPADQMKDYAGEIGGSVTYSSANKDSGYSITIDKNNIVYHRKCIMSGSTAIYYDFQYSAMSSSRARYEQCIAYIDNNMKTK